MQCLQALCEQGLNNWQKFMIGEYQGFWKGKPCVIYVFTVKQILEKCWEGCMYLIHIKYL